jgi:hypothetical protein
MALDLKFVKGASGSEPATGRRTLPLPGPTAANKQKQRTAGGAGVGFCVGWRGDHGEKGSGDGERWQGGLNCEFPSLMEILSSV